MLTNLRIRNFKAWEDTGDIRLAPITLFFGANSSGKSSIGQFLMMLKLTTESRNRREVLTEGFLNSPLQFGPFRNIVHHRDPTLHIEFAYTWDNPYIQFQITDPANDVIYPYNELAFQANIGLTEEGAEKLVVNEFSYSLNNNIEIGYQRNDGVNAEYSVTSTGYTLRQNPSRTRSLPEPDQFYGFPDEVIVSYQNAAFVQDLAFIHKQLFESLYYLGPLRTPPKRIYSWSGSGYVDDVSYDGELTVAALLVAEREYIGVPGQPAEMTVPQIVQFELTKMGLVSDIATYRIDNRASEYGISVQVPGSADRVDLPDVGFGISQVLPVVVQCFCAPINSIIVIEQPEMHLHPRAQAALADVVIDVINSSKIVGHDDEGNEIAIPRNIQLIIETHSEHFLRRLQRRIAENKLPEERVAAYFAEMCDGKATLNQLKIDEFGNIANWPKDFFGDQFGDIAEHSIAAAKKKQAQVANGGANAQH